MWACPHLSLLQTLIQNAPGLSWKLHFMNLKVPWGFHKGFEDRFLLWKELHILLLMTSKSRMFVTCGECIADAYGAMPLLWTPVVRVEKFYGQVCACTCYPWRFSSQGNTVCVVKIVLLIEHLQNWLQVCVCMCVLLCVVHASVFFFFFLSITLLRIKMVQSVVNGSNPGHNEMIEKLK